MVDFENYAEEFKNWLLPGGDRDVVRHQRFLNSLLDVLLAHCTQFIGFNYFPMGEKRQQREAYKRCVTDAVKNCNRDISQEIPSALSVVFADYPEVSDATVLDIFKEHNLGDKLASCTVTTPIRAKPLQAADLVAYELNAVQQPGHIGRYPFRRLKEKATRLTISTKWDNCRWGTAQWGGTFI